MSIIEPDSNRLVFFHIPLVNIQFHDIKLRESFDLNATMIGIRCITEIFVQNNFNLTANVDTTIDPVTIISYSNIAEKLIDQGAQSSTLQVALSSLADGYKDRYICFIIQNGFYSSEELEYIIIDSNAKTEMKAMYYKGMNFYEIYFVSATQINFIVWDNLKNEVFINEIDIRCYQKNKDIFQKKSIEKQLKRLIKKYNKSIIKIY
ncbi:MAG: hypothetical protein PHH30_03275 [Bacteroidales bacterium]|nr:hypothetical protein [Bacteroidales bacterium]